MDGGLAVKGSGDAQVQGSTQGSEHIKSASETEIQCPPDLVSPEGLQRHLAQIKEFEKKQLDAQKKVDELDKRITNIEKSCLSTQQRFVRAAKAAIIVVVAGTLLARVVYPLLIGLVLGAIAFVVVGYLLYQNNCSRRAQVKILRHLECAQLELGNTTKKLDAAYSNLFDMEVKATEQEKLITGQGQTVEEQLKQINEQATQISTLKQTNAEIEQNLQAVQQAREDSNTKAQEITDTATNLQQNLAEAQTHVRTLEERAKKLESEHTEQAAELQQQAKAMKAFVDGQQKMIKKLQRALRTNKRHLDDMMQRTATCSNDVSVQLEAIKKYVGDNFVAVQNDLRTAADALKEMTKCASVKQPTAETVQNAPNAATAAPEEMTEGADGNTSHTETIAQAQEKVTNAITTSVVRLGSMQAHIIDSLTEAQTALSKYVEETKKKRGETWETFKACRKKFRKLKTDAEEMQKNIASEVKTLEQRKKLADARIQEIQKSDTGDQKSGWFGRFGFGQTQLEKAKAEANKIQQELENLQKPLKDLQTQVAEAQKQAEKVNKSHKAIKAENEMIALSCEALKAQNEKLSRSNNRLFDYIKKTRTNVQAAGKSIDRVSQNVDAAATNVSNVDCSRWCEFFVNFCSAGAAAQGAAMSGYGAMAIGGAAAVGVFTPIAVICVASYVGKAAFDSVKNILGRRG